MTREGIEKAAFEAMDEHPGNGAFFDASTFTRALGEQGYQVVPVKLTDEMENAIAIAWHEIVKDKELRAPIHWMQACHSAMLAAAGK